MNKSAQMFQFSSKLWYAKRRVAADGTVSLYLQVVVNGRHKEFPLKLRWPADKIDLVNGELLPRKRKDAEATDYNLLVQLERAKHVEIFTTYRLRKAHLDIKKFSQEVKTFDARESFASYMHHKILYRYETKDITDLTKKNCMGTLSLMLRFNAHWRFSEIDITFLKKFKNWMATTGYVVKKERRQYEATHIWSKIRDIKAYLQLATKEPMISVNREALEFSNPEPEVLTDFLELDEVRRLMILHRNGGLSENEEKVLSAFLFTCFTGLRISDVYRVEYAWLISDTHIEFLPHKNRKKSRTIRIPIMPMAKQFIQNMEGKFFTLPSQGEYNLLLKGLANKAEINKELSSHYGRHTFGHLFMETVGNLKALQENLGHKKITTTTRYAHLTDEYKYRAVKQIQDKFADLMLRKAK